MKTSRPKHPVFMGLKFMATRSGIWYLLVFLLLIRLVNFAGVKLSRLDYLTPSFRELINISQTLTPRDKEKLGPYIRYYEKVLEYSPRIAEASILLGSCYYYAGDKEKAVLFYEEAVQKAPRFFWPTYNLGVIYFKDGLFEKAVESFLSALSVQPDVSRKLIDDSFVYKQFFTAAGISDAAVTQGLKESRKNACKLLVLSLLRLKRFQLAHDMALYAASTFKDSKDFFYYYTGLAEYEMKQYSQALPFFQACFNINPQRITALYYQGLCYQNLGIEKTAAELLTRVAAMKGKNVNDPTPTDGQGIEVRFF
jgi:tetratricopeptide (TPR) repeat protein